MKRIYSAIGKFAGLYEIALRLSGYQKSVEFFVSQLPFPRDAEIDVLDAGCGNGLYSFAVLRRYPNSRVTAFDADRGLTDYFQQQALREGVGSRATIFTADITSQLQQIQKEFDLVITAGVLEYVPLKETVANLSRFLRIGGYFFNSPLRTTVWGNIVAKMYGCRPYPRQENIEAFTSKYELTKIISLPPMRPASFKEGHHFRKLRD